MRLDMVHSWGYPQKDRVKIAMHIGALGDVM